MTVELEEANAKGPGITIVSGGSSQYNSEESER